jgi:hypothetical protein
VSAVATGAVQLSDVRARAAVALAPRTDDEPDVHMDVVDSVSPPALLLLWADPWLNPTTLGGMGGGGGLWDSWFEVIAVAGRLEPGPGIEKCEELVTYALARLREDDYAWPPETFYAPREIVIGGVHYLGARMIFRVPVTI